MSSPKRAQSRRAVRGKTAKTPAKVLAKPAAAKTAKPDGDRAIDAKALASNLERALTDGDLDVLPPQALQDLMAALCKTYSAQIEAGRDVLPLRGRTSVSSTDIMTTASGLLKVANLAVFELGMWQSWTGR
jgi:hypothetical protein